MAARSRPRGAPSKDDDAHEEERNMWKQIVTDMKKLKTINARAAEVSRLIVESEDKMGADAAPSVREIDRLQEYYREGLKLAEEEQKILKEDPNGAIQNIGILNALRTASEIDVPRASTALKPRNPKRTKIDTDVAIESPAPSPSIASTASHPRLKGSVGRSGSVSSIAKDGKDTAVKIEEGLNASGVEGVKGTSAEKAGLLVKNAEVAYKQSKVKDFEGEWIQCIIISVTGEGKQKRYEVQDPEPDENGAPGRIYKTTASTLIPVPPAGASLPDFPKGKQVLAKYPETTTFYRAEVMGMKRESYRLRFEGEDEIGKEQDVDRRYVLDYGAK
ncbi:MAG: SAGA HAT/Core module component [Thelocarpon superellum]|nr:MAG: SAGA HAT/Core module component [Thelocarpon superellum]